jgi:uncharacterized protein DUF5947
VTGDESALARIVRRTAARGAARTERCELCGTPIPEEHRHLVDLDRGGLLCACRPCSILFDREAASNGRLRLVPNRRVRLDIDTTPQALGAPVGLAYFVKASDGTVRASYPSPLGATSWEVEPALWQALEVQAPELAGMQPEVEALLLNTTQRADDRWLVPVDDCYRLVALIRREWRGMSGGTAVWREIERFFDERIRRRRGRTTSKQREEPWAASVSASRT